MTGGGLDDQFAAMRLADRLGDRQPQTQTFGGAGVTGVLLQEGLQAVLEFLWRQPRPLVLYRDYHRAIGPDMPPQLHGSAIE